MASGEDCLEQMISRRDWSALIFVTGSFFERCLRLWAISPSRVTEDWKAVASAA